MFLNFVRLINLIFESTDCREYYQLISATRWNGLCRQYLKMRAQFILISFFINQSKSLLSFQNRSPSVQFPVWACSISPSISASYSVVSPVEGAGPCRIWRLLFSDLCLLWAPTCSWRTCLVLSIIHLVLFALKIHCNALQTFFLCSFVSNTIILCSKIGLKFMLFGLSLIILFHFLWGLVYWLWISKGGHIDMGRRRAALIFKSAQHSVDS